MPIFDQGYQHWHGTPGNRIWRWLAITRQGVRMQLKNRRTKYLVIASCMPALVLVAFLAIWGLFEQKSDFIKPFLMLFQGLPEEVREGPRAFRTSIWSLAFNFYLMLEIGLSLLLTLLVGPDLISQDLRFNAFPLYLSRPLRRSDYFLGKLGVIVVFIGAVTILPAVLAYVVGVAFSLDLSVLRDTWRILLASVAYGAIVAVVCGLVMLAFSSLSRNSRIVAAMWVGLWIVTNTIAGVLIAVTNPALQREVARRHGQLAEAPQRSIEQPDTRWVAVSFSGNLDCLRLWMLGTEGAYQQLMDAMLKSVKPAMEAAENMRRNPMARMFGGRRRRREVVEVDLDSDGAPEQVATPEFLQGLKPPFPWTWSAGILAGLCGLSLCILSTRVKSLDRLR